MSTQYSGGAVILHPLTREILKTITEKIAAQTKDFAPRYDHLATKQVTYETDAEKCLDLLLQGKFFELSWSELVHDSEDGDYERIYAAVCMSITIIDAHSFYLYFAPDYQLMPNCGVIDFSWHLKKILELTDSLKLGACVFEDVTCDDENCTIKPLQKWGVYTWSHPLMLNMMNFNKTAFHDYVLKMQSVLNLVVNKLSTLGWQIQSYDFSEKTLNDLEFSLYAKSAESSIQIRYTEDEVHIIPLGNKPTNLRPCLEILSIVCEGANMSYIEANSMVVNRSRF